MENHFNLIDEPWIPIADAGLVSLEQIFTHPEYRALGGNPVQKIVLIKFLQAISQACATSEDDEEWKAIGASGLAEKCRSYLKKWKECFYLYGEKPFLQIPEISTAAKKNYCALMPEISTGNTTVHTQHQIERPLDDAAKALLLVTLMSFALGGKKVDNSISLTKDYKGKTKSGKAGPAMAYKGMLHNFLMGETLQKTVWLNTLTHEDIKNCSLFAEGVGRPPWEQMPEGEDCAVAQQMKKTLMGRLIPLCRFCLLAPDGIHYSEGLQHLNYLDGIYDPTIAADSSGKKTKVLWADPEKRPWRILPALLAFIKSGKGESDCLQLRAVIPRAKDNQNTFAVWSGGLRVSYNAGEQFVSGNDDFVESEIRLTGKLINETWFNQLELEMSEMENISKKLYGCILSFYKTQLADGKKFSEQGLNIFWQACESHFQELVDACDNANPDARMERSRLRQKFAGHALEAYNQFCPNDTARQLDAWAKCRPNLSKYLKKEDS